MCMKQNYNNRISRGNYTYISVPTLVSYEVALKKLRLREVKLIVRGNYEKIKCAVLQDIYHSSRIYFDVHFFCSDSFHSASLSYNLVRTRKVKECT